MENVAKALLIAAGMFMAMLIMSALVMSYNEISSYYEQKHELTVAKQTEKFNKKFEAYNRNNVRGSELISFMNKIIDYNATEVYNSEKGYKRIKVTIELGGNEILNQFKYKDTYATNQYLLNEITNKNGDDWNNDLKLINITGTPADLSGCLAAYDIANITDSQLQQLSANISNIMADENNPEDTFNRLKRADVLKKILGITLDINSDTGESNDIRTKNIIRDVKNVVSQYYQYMQFKRAYFDCAEMIYDTETNRVVEINFTLKTEDGNVVFN